MQDEDSARPIPKTFIVDLYAEGAEEGLGRRIVQSDTPYRAIREAAHEEGLPLGAYVGAVNDAQRNGYFPPLLVPFTIQSTGTTELVFPGLREAMTTEGGSTASVSIKAEDRR